MLYHIFHSLLLLIIILLFAQCESKGTIEPPATFFISPFPDKEINLEKKLGSVISVSNGYDIIDLHFSFNPTDKTNLISGSTPDDTIFYGKISKHKGIYYLSTQRSDSCFWITAIKIRDGYIKGLGAEWEQMYEMDAKLNMDSSCVLRKLVIQNKINALIPDRKILKSYFEKYIDSLPELKIIHPAEKIISDGKPENPEEEDYDISVPSKKIIDKYYPNPIQDYLTLEIAKEGSYELNVYTSEGLLLHKESFTGKVKQINFRDIPTGNYFLKISNGSESETVKILVDIKQ
ncbi:MAG: T9SS type A sorting domain-containing protein [Cytophagaceae bacterium]|nr:T9SS type A sorting domain-containing protein [Cytophagaceae bacterium]